MNKVSIQEFAGGALREQFERAFEKVIENLIDPNTSYKEPRKITIALKFTQNEQRNDVYCDISVTEKLASQAPNRTSFAVGKDLKTGTVYANEYGKQITITDLNTDTETGEIFEEESEKNGKIINFRRA